jgi:squalene-hopene/tetraprenyl-beta-curcumene cyclase
MKLKTPKRESPLIAAFVLTVFCGACSHSATKAGDAWNRRAAAAYLDQREATWSAWPRAARDRGTFCVSCHTVLPYALSRQAVDSALEPNNLAPNERKLVDDVTKRVQLWNEIQPYYPSQASASRGTEAVLNAIILASYDARSGKLSPTTLSAFKEMWSLQQTTGLGRGAWQWIEFNNEPWEAYDSPFYGATLAAIATGLAPEDYRSSPEIQPNLDLLRDYLHREYPAQTLLNRVSLLWASARIPGLLSPEEQQSILREILSKQQSDGGWSASSLVGTWKRKDKTPLVTKSDGYATGLVTYALQQVGLGPSDAHVRRGLTWLAQNQSWGGHWNAYSLNKRRLNPFSNPSSFMDDAATAYAVLALTAADAPHSTTAHHLLLQGIVATGHLHPDQ